MIFLGSHRFFFVKVFLFKNFFPTSCFMSPTLANQMSFLCPNQIFLMCPPYLSLSCPHHVPFICATCPFFVSATYTSRCVLDMSLPCPPTPYHSLPSFGSDWASHCRYRGRYELPLSLIPIPTVITTWLCAQRCLCLSTCDPFKHRSFSSYYLAQKNLSRVIHHGFWIQIL